MRKPCPPRTLGRNAVSATVRAGSSSRPLRGVHRSAPSALLLDPIKRSRRCWVFARSGQPTWPHFVSQKTWFREIPRRVASTSRLLRNDVSALRLGGDVSVDDVVPPVLDGEKLGMLLWEWSRKQLRMKGGYCASVRGVSHHPDHCWGFRCCAACCLRTRPGYSVPQNSSPSTPGNARM